jgi:hypothetical protein
MLEESARRIASQVVPVLNQVQNSRQFGCLAAAGRAALEYGEKAKDLRDAGATVFEAAARANQRVAGEARALAGAAAHAKVAGQIGFDLVRARIAVSQAEETLRMFKSPAAESALVFMRPEMHKLQAAFESERAFQSKYREIASSLQNELNGSASRLGELALSAEKVASKSAIGRSILATGKVLTNEWIGRSLMVLGLGIASFKGFQEAPTNSTRWKIAYGASAGVGARLSDAGMGAAVARGENPVALLYDPTIKYGAKALGFGDAGDKLTIGKFYDQTMKTVVAYTQYWRTGDMEPLTKVHELSMKGEGSGILRGYSMIGDVLARSALVDTLLTKTADWQKNVPDDFKTSPSWWSAIKTDANSLLDVGKGALISAGEALGLSDEK